MPDTGDAVHCVLAVTAVPAGYTLLPGVAPNLQP